MSLSGAGHDAERRVDDDGLGAAIDHFPRSSEYTWDQYTPVPCLEKNDSKQAAVEKEDFGKNEPFFFIQRLLARSSFT